MKIKNISNVKGFFDTIQKCKGSVELVTSEGDRLNLKSTLCQYIAITQMFDEAKIKDVDLIISEPEDTAKLLDFLIKG